MRIELDQVEDIVLDGVNGADHPDYVDAHIAYAVWKHNGEALSDHELDILQDSNPEYASENAFDHLIGIMGL